MKDIEEAIALINAHAPIRGYRVVSDEELVEQGVLEEILASRKFKIGQKVIDDNVIARLALILMDAGVDETIAEDIAIRFIMELRNV